VNLEAIYPNAQEEYSFEELRARKRGWMDRKWQRKPPSPLRPVLENIQRSPTKDGSEQMLDIENLSQEFHMKATVEDTSNQPLDLTHAVKPPKQKRIKVREVKQETQTGKYTLEHGHDIYSTNFS
jgi:checkpoint serine/threonine-protein kinase